jgi:hypothetical protein
VKISQNFLAYIKFHDQKESSRVHRINDFSAVPPFVEKFLIWFRGRATHKVVYIMAWRPTLSAAADAYFELALKNRSFLLRHSPILMFRISVRPLC